MKKDKHHHHVSDEDFASSENTPNPDLEQQKSNAENHDKDSGNAWQGAEPATENTEEPTVKLDVDETAKLQQEIAELNDKILRIQADYQNFRKRSVKDLGDARRGAVMDTVLPFLQLFDLMHMAKIAAEKSDNIAAIKQGLNMIFDGYEKSLDELGIKSFDAKGVKFDPELHEAISTEASESVPEGVVIKQWNCGYKMGDRVLRVARVVVSSGKPESAAAPADADATKIDG